MLTAELAATLYWSEGHERSMQLSADAVKLARSNAEPDSSVLIYTLWRHHYALWSPDNLDDRLAIAGELINLADNAGMRFWALRAREMYLADCLELGDLQRVEAARRSYAELQHRLGITDSLLDLLDSMAATMRGDFAEAEQAAERALVTGQRSEQPGALLSYTAQTGMIRFEQGRLGELEPMLKAYAEQFPMLDVLRSGIALAYVQSGRSAEARAEFEYLARNDFSSLRRDWNWLGAMAVATEVCVFLRDRDRARRLYEMLAPYADRCIMVGWCEVSYGGVARYLGMLCALLQQYDESERYFEAALAMHKRLGALPLLAHSQFQFAEMLMSRGGVDDREQASKLIEAALKTADLLGMNELSNATRSVRHSLNLSKAIVPEIRSARDRLLLDQNRTLVTVLFVDLVESTQTAAKLGDQKWREILGRFYTDVRRHLAEYDGDEIANPGDGFLAVFDSPSTRSPLRVESVIRCVC